MKQSLTILKEVRQRYRFVVLGSVVMLTLVAATFEFT